MKKLSSFVLSLMLIVVAMFNAVACVPNGGVDNSKTTILNVYNYGGGFGNAWIESLVDRFEADFAEHEFEPGKKGVKVEVSYQKTNGMDEVNASSGSGVDVYFCQEINYYDAAVVKGAFLDITDIVTEPLTKYNESKSIKDKLGTISFTDD